jgi:hypothetical protein
VVEIQCIEVSCGDPGYVSKGHMDKRQFLDAVIDYELRNGIIGNASEFSFDIEDVRHSYQRDATEEEASAKGYDTYAYFCKPDEDGAYAITVVYP